MPVDYQMLRKGTASLGDYQRLQEEFELEKQKAMASASGQDPASVKLANEIQKARAAGDTQRLNDLQMSAKLLDRGVVYDQMGNPIAMGGYGDAIGTIAGTKKAYEAEAQNASDLAYDPLIAGGEAKARLEQQQAYEPSIEAQKASEKLKAEDLAKAQIGAPNAIAQAQEMQRVIKEIEASPGMSAVVGLRNPLKGAIPFTEKNIRGTPAADFQAKLEQLGGKQFLEAFQSLKGGGAITEIEGQKAEKAIARMQTSQSEVEFKKALKELAQVVNDSTNRLQSKTGVTSGPKMGDVVDGYMFNGGDPSDQNSWKRIK